MRKRLICDSWSNFIRHINLYPFSRGAPCAPTFFLLCWVEFNKNCPTDWLQKKHNVSKRRPDNRPLSGDWCRPLKEKGVSPLQVECVCLHHLIGSGTSKASGRVGTTEPSSREQKPPSAGGSEASEEAESSQSKMTVSYQYDVASSASGGFIRLLFRWRGSVWKVVYREMAIFTVCYVMLSLLYNFALTESQKR